MDMACVPAQRPLHEVIIHLVRERREVISIAHLKADDGDQVRKLRHGAPLDLFRLPDGIAFPPVSYTHLDVYKRQPPNLLLVE